MLLMKSFIGYSIIRMAKESSFLYLLNPAPGAFEVTVMFRSQVYLDQSTGSTDGRKLYCTVLYIDLMSNFYHKNFYHLN